MPKRRGRRRDIRCDRGGGGGGNYCGKFIIIRLFYAGSPVAGHANTRVNTKKKNSHTHMGKHTQGERRDPVANANARG